jgi:hypothetical protein
MLITRHFTLNFHNNNYMLLMSCQVQKIDISIFLQLILLSFWCVFKGKLKTHLIMSVHPQITEAKLSDYINSNSLS